MPWHALRLPGAETPQRLLKFHSSGLGGLLHMLAALCRDWCGLEKMEDKENQLPRTSQKAPVKAKRCLHPQGYHYGPLGFSKPLCHLGPPASLRGMLPEDPVNLKRKYWSAEDIFVLTAKPKQKPKSTRKLACTLMWGDDEEDGLECDCGQWSQRALQKSTGDALKLAEDVDGCVLAKTGFAGNANGPEDLMVEEASGEVFESDAEHQVSQEKAQDDEDNELECDCGHGPNRTDLKSADDVV
uniref:Uncharacterized protein n=1 Tax=Pogona vitticeps TaxID=103695 RepID=A0ABM5FYK8_9SAUR